MKFVGQPKHPFDYAHQKKVAQKLDALLNATVIDTYGSTIGQVKYADGNTAFQVAISSDRWQKPYKELDPDRFVNKGTWVYISPENPIVTTGMTDPIAGAGTKAYSGIWEAAQDVPASTGVDDYNVPQTDYPGATGTPTGTTPNYKGDLDGADVYWILICPTCGL